MSKLEEAKKVWIGKSDEWLYERLANELTSKVEEIHRLLNELSEVKKLNILNVSVSFPCCSLNDVKQNSVAILALMGNTNLTTKEDIKEIDEIAMEIYKYCDDIILAELYNKLR